MDSKADAIYKGIIREILEEGQGDYLGDVRPVYYDGTPAHTKSIFGVQAVFEPGEIPLVTVKRTPAQTSINEVVHAFFQMRTNRVKDFEELGIGYWKEWEDKNGTIGMSYGRQLSHQKELIKVDGRYYHLDQVEAILHRLEKDPFSRRIMFSYWNPGDVHQKALQECAYSGQFNVRPDSDGRFQLDFILIQRSVDVLHGLPSNWAGYYALQCALAELFGYKVGKFIHQMGNVHLYDNQFDIAKDILLNETQSNPGIYVNPDIDSFQDFEVGDIKYTDYKSAGSYRTDVAI